MIPALKSEFRKIFSVRSTYGIAAFVFALVVLFAFFIGGIKANPASLNDSNLLADQVISAITAVSGMFCFVGVLLVTHEYRYNTIMYTLTASRSRSRTLLAKVIAVSIFALGMSLVVGVLSPALTYLGIHLSGHELGHQVLPIGNLLLRCLFYSWAYSMIALAFAAIIRNQVGTLLAVFLVPNVEPILTLLLKNNAVYLPFAALGQVTASAADRQHGPFVTGSLSPTKGALVFGIYLLIGWIVAYILFLRRDAN